MSIVTLDFTATVTVNMTVRAGCGAVVTMTLTRAGAPVNLTGALIKYYANTPTPIIKTVGAGIVIVGPPANGICQMTIEDSDTSSITASTGVQHEGRIQLATEEPAMLFDGALQIEQALFTTM